MPITIQASMPRAPCVSRRVQRCDLRGAFLTYSWRYTLSLAPNLILRPPTALLNGELMSVTPIWKSSVRTCLEMVSNRNSSVKMASIPQEFEFDIRTDANTNCPT